MSKQEKYVLKMQSWMITMREDLSKEGGYVKERRILENSIAELSFSSDLEQVILRIWWGVLEDIYQFWPQWSENWKDKLHSLLRKLWKTR
jgi:hypothetical protein